MGNCPTCGADLGIGIAICPNCGGDIVGEASEVAETQEMETVSDTIGEHSVEPGDHGTTGQSRQVDGPDTTTPLDQIAGPDQMDPTWVGDAPPAHQTIGVDSSVTGSEIPPSHGGGFTQQGEDGTAPHDMTHVQDLDRPVDEFPDRPGSDLGLDDSGRMFPQRLFPAIVVLVLVVIVALAGWYILAADDDDDGNGDDNGNGEPNGNGHDPLKGLHLHKDGTSGNYPYEPPGEYHVTVAVRNNGSSSVDLSDYQVSITVWIDYVNKGDKVETLSGTLGAGKTTTFDVVVETEVLGGGDQLLVGLTLRKVVGAEHVQTINFDDTV